MPEPFTEKEVRDAWLKRADALGLAQARYLWTMFLVGLFFFALKTRESPKQDIKLPFFDLEVGAQAVLATGGLTIAFLVVAFAGAMKAWGVALKAATGDDWEKAADYLDLHPTAFDLAYFTVRGATPALERMLYVTYYPGFLALLVVEAVWLQWWLWTNPSAFQPIFLVLGTPTLVWAAWLVGDIWLGRILRVYRQLRAG